MLNRMALDYQQRAEITLLVGLALITCLLWLRYKSIVTTLQTLAPAFLAALMILALQMPTAIFLIKNTVIHTDCDR
jgi:predicted RND superfamily exporter protein